MAALTRATMLAAGCASGLATSGAAAGGTTASGTVAGQLLIEGDQDLVNFAGRPMNDVNMLDPTPFGELDLGDVPGMANNDFGRNSPQFYSGITCRHLLPPGITDDGSRP